MSATRKAGLNPNPTMQSASDTRAGNHHRTAVITAQQPLEITGTSSFRASGGLLIGGAWMKHAAAIFLSLPVLHAEMPRTFIETHCV